MKRYLWIATALAAVLALSGCLKQAETDQPGAPIQFTASVGQYTKVLNNAFELQDDAGLFVGAPLNKNNVKLSWDGEKLVPETPLYWGVGQQEKSLFRAYYPYNSHLTELTGSMVFTIAGNQSTHEKYSQSDLMVASTEAGPADGGVHLSFNHLMSKLTVKVVNQSGEAIRDAYFAGLATGSTINCETMQAGEAVWDYDDDDMFIRPASLQDAEGGSYYSVIVPPQKAEQFGLVIALASGQVSLYMSSAIFESGKQYRGTITVEAAAVGDEIPFTLSMAEWGEGSDLRFTDAAVGQRAGWRISYFPVGASYSILPMEEKAPGAFMVNLPDYREGDVFRIMSANNNYIMGCNIVYPQPVGQNNNEWPVDVNSQCRLEGYTGNLNVWFYPDEGIMRYEPVYPDWKELGDGEYVWGIEPSLSNDWGFEYRCIPKAFPAKVWEDKTRPGVYRFETPIEGWDSWSHNTFIIDASNPNQVFIRPSEFTLFWNFGWDENEHFTLESAVPENRVTFPEEEAQGKLFYGVLNNGVISRPGLLKRTYEEGDFYYFYAQYTQFVLPGYTRLPLLSTSALDLDQWEKGEDGTWYALFRIRRCQDVETFRYLMVPGYLKTDEELTTQLLTPLRAGEGTPVEFDPSEEFFTMKAPIPADGKYTFMYMAQCPSINELAYSATYTLNYFTLPQEEPEGEEQDND